MEDFRKECTAIEKESARDRGEKEDATSCKSHNLGGQAPSEQDGILSSPLTLDIKIGAAGIEPTTSCTPSKRAKPLRHAPIGAVQNMRSPGVSGEAGRAEHPTILKWEQYFNRPHNSTP